MTDDFSVALPTADELFGDYQRPSKDGVKRRGAWTKEEKAAREAWNDPDAREARLRDAYTKARDAAIELAAEVASTRSTASELNTRVLNLEAELSREREKCELLTTTHQSFGDEVAQFNRARETAAFATTCLTLITGKLIHQRMVTSENPEGHAVVILGDGRFSYEVNYIARVIGMTDTTTDLTKKFEHVELGFSQDGFTSNALVQLAWRHGISPEELRQRAEQLEAFKGVFAQPNPLRKPTRPGGSSIFDKLSDYRRRVREQNLGRVAVGSLVGAMGLPLGFGIDYSDVFAVYKQADQPNGSEPGLGFGYHERDLQPYRSMFTEDKGY